MEKRILNAMRFIKQIDNCRSKYKGYWLIDNIQCFCDGYMGIILNNYIDEIEEVEDSTGNLNLIEVIKRFDKFSLYENIDLKKAKKVKNVRGQIYLDISDTYFLNKRIEIAKGMLGNKVKAYTKIDEDSGYKDKVLFLENENGKAMILCIRK